MQLRSVIVGRIKLFENLNRNMSIGPNYGITEN